MPASPPRGRGCRPGFGAKMMRVTFSTTGSSIPSARHDPAPCHRGPRLELAVSLDGGGDEELVRAVRDVVAGAAARRDAGVVLRDRDVEHQGQFLVARLLLAPVERA